LAALKNKDEFESQVNAHSAKIEALFGQKPTVFRNTELIYNNDIGDWVAAMGFKAAITEGAKHILGWKSPNYVYCSASNPRLKLLLKNYRLSDDIAFRFSDKGWNEFPLTAEKFIGWIKALDAKEETLNLFMNYDTFGNLQPKESGIFDFLKAFPKVVLSTNTITFSTPSEVVNKFQPVSPLFIPHPISWSDEERDTSAWLGNELQKEAAGKLYALREKVLKINDAKIQTDWKYLQTSDHFYYMCTKFFIHGSLHSYFNPFNSPYDAFINYMNILSDFEIRVNQFNDQPVNDNGNNKTRNGTKKTVAKVSKTVASAKPNAEKANKDIKAKKTEKESAKGNAAKKPIKPLAAKTASKKTETPSNKENKSKAAAAKPVAKIKGKSSSKVKKANTKK
jgi:alpha-amylase